MKRLFKCFIATLKAYQDFETRISMLKSLTPKAKTRRVRITDNQMEILIICGRLGINDKKQIIDMLKYKTP